MEIFFLVYAYLRCLVLDCLLHLCPGLLDRNVDQISNDGIDVTSMEPHLGEFGGLNFDEGGVTQLGNSSRNFRLAHPRGTATEKKKEGRM